ncbi:MAG: ATP-binding protein [Chloroflexota bacterium]
MLTYLRQVLLEPPTLTSLRQTKLARQLHYLLLFGFCFILIYSSTLILLDDARSSIISSIMGVIVLILIWLLHHGYFGFASTAIITSSSIAVFAAMTINGGIRHSALVIIVMLLTLSSLFLGAKGTIRLGIMATLFVCVLFFLERMGLIVDPESVNPPQITDLFISLAAIVVTATFQRQIISDLVHGREQIHEQASSLQKQNLALHKAHRSLQERSNELSRTLTQLQAIQHELIEAKEIAEAANQAKSAFLAHMSHELRTPLNGIIGFAQLLQLDDNLTREQLDNIAMIDECGSHLLLLISDILDLAKIEANKIEFEKSQCDVRKMADTVIGIMDESARSKELSLYYKLANDVPTQIEVDERRLRQIFVNLVGNAVKFTQQGEVVLKVQPARVCEPNKPGYMLLNFSVTDTGIGIAADELNHIFDPFEQAGSSQQRAVGTGLGLAITRRLVGAMGGELRVESKEGEGTTFWFELCVRMGV